MNRISQCDHKVSEIWESYCSGFTTKDNGLDVCEIRKCKDCGWTWIETHKGNYVQNTPSVKADDKTPSKDMKFEIV